MSSISRVELVAPDSAARAAPGRTPRARGRATRSISMSVGATKVPCAHLRRQRRCVHGAAARAHRRRYARSMPSRASAVMTGPTSVDEPVRVADRELGHRALQHRAACARRRPPAGRARAAPSSAGRRCRRRRRARRATTCSASAEESTIMRVLAAGLGDQRDRAAVAGRAARPAARWISRATRSSR